MKKLSLSKFDLGFIIAFVVVTLLGFGAYWYLSGVLQDSQAADATAKAAYDKNAANAKYHVAVSTGNLKTLQANIDLIKAQINPLIPSKLQTKDNKLNSIEKEDPVAWKHDLDDTVHRLTAAAKAHAVTLPPNFYFSFSRYLSQSPGDEQTTVLSKQLIAVDQIASVLIQAPVKSIDSIGRTYEEDPHTAGNNPFAVSGDSDHLSGFSFSGVGNSYVSYPFQVEFVTTAENFRSVVNNLIQAPYVFIIRTVSVTNSALDSPQLNDLDTLAAGGSVGSQGADASQGGAPAGGKAPPQFLFGESTISVKMRVDLIEWKGVQP